MSELVTLQQGNAANQRRQPGPISARLVGSATTSSASSLATQLDRALERANRHRFTRIRRSPSSWLARPPMLKFFAVLGTLWGAFLAAGVRGKNFIFPASALLEHECAAFSESESIVLPHLRVFTVSPARPLISALKGANAHFKRRTRDKHVRFGSSIIEDWEQRECYTDERLFRKRMETIRRELGREKRRRRYSSFLACGVLMLAVYSGCSLVGLFGTRGSSWL